MYIKAEGVQCVRKGGQGAKDPLVYGQENSYIHKSQRQCFSRYDFHESYSSYEKDEQ